MVPTGYQSLFEDNMLFSERTLWYGTKKCRIAAAFFHAGKDSVS
jgi:hypothetical protein